MYNTIYQRDVRVSLLSFDEKNLDTIQGKIISGNVSIDGSSSIRRTINLTVALDDKTQIQNYFINSKIKVEIEDNEEWEPLGIYLISEMNVNETPNSLNINIKGKDKMCLLDGTLGGVFPSPVILHEKYQTGKKPVSVSILEIIQEVLVHYGKESLSNIFISGLTVNGKAIMKYVGKNPVYFKQDFSTLTDSLEQAEQWNGYIVKYKNEDVGYGQTIMRYPGELIAQQGETVVDILQKICGFLTNFEFFYDLQGHFIFQEKKNYTNTSPSLNELSPSNYLESFYSSYAALDMSDDKYITSISHSPQYPNIKNDFIVWGKQNTASGANLAIRYHLAIDTKPQLNKAKKYMWEIKEGENIVRYEYTEQEQNITKGASLIAPPGLDWREELYRNALEASLTTSHYSDYDMELLAEWRKLYDPNKWKDNNNWNPNVQQHPETLTYWLDFLDTDSEFGKYSIEQVGKRTLVINDERVHTVMNKDIPDVFFVNETVDAETKQYYDKIGQTIFQVPKTSTWADKFTISSRPISAYDKIRELLFLHLNYNAGLQISCIPIFDLEPNTIIIAKNFLGEKKSYFIQSIQLPLAYNSLMSLSAYELNYRI